MTRQLPDGFNGYPLSSLGAQLVWWRKHRAQSQLALALEAAVSTRHLSFLENDRATPSREVLCRLAAALDLPPRATNSLLAAAGLSPQHSDMDPADVDRARRTLIAMADNHTPNPAIVIDRLWNVVHANEAMTQLTDLLLSHEDQQAAGAPNIMRLTYHPRGLRRFIDNWDETANAYLQWLHRDARHFGDPAIAALLTEVRDLAGTVDSQPRLDDPSDPFLNIRFRDESWHADFFTVAANLGTAYDSTLHELRVELFYATDNHTTRFMRDLVDSATDSSEVPTSRSRGGQ